MCLIVLVVYFDVMVCYLIVVDCAFLLLLLTVACLVYVGLVSCGFSIFAGCTCL